MAQTHPVNRELARGFRYPEFRSRYENRDLALYALGVGAANGLQAQQELQWVYEGAEGFCALPSFSVLHPVTALMAYGAEQGQLAPGLEVGLDRILHGEQQFTLERPLPSAAELVHRSAVVEVFDTGAHAVVHTRTETFEASTNALLVTNDMRTVLRGAGGFGGPKPAEPSVVRPSRPPDLRWEAQTALNQALLYRLSGDWNPLHADPALAAMFGFERPILHGLCTFGFITRAVLHAALGGEAQRLKSLSARFAKPVFPGETIVVELWKEPDGSIPLRATVRERAVEIISQAVALPFS